MKSPSALKKLEALGFDPLKELVKMYQQLSHEVVRQEEIRTGKLVELTSTGKPKAYRPEVHHALFDRMIKINETLIRYKYARVPESIPLTLDPPKPLVIQLTGEDDQDVG